MTLPPRALVAESRHIVYALDAAIAVLDRLGWCQPGVNNAGGYPVNYYGVSIHDAFLRSLAPRPWCAGAIYALSKVVAPAGRGTSIELLKWNDARGRTKADVDALIHRVRGDHQ